MPLNPVSGEIEAQPINDNFSYLESLLLQVNGGPIDEVSTESELNAKYPNGANGIVLVNGYLYLWNGSSWKKGSLYQSQGLADKSVVAAKVVDATLPTNKLEEYTSNLLAKKRTGKNLFNPAKAVDGFYVNHTNGQLYANEDYFTTEKIFAEPGTKIAKNINERVAFFNINKTEFVSGVAPGQATFTMPPDCYFFQTNGQVTLKSKFQIEIGNNSTEYEPYKEFLDPEQLGENTVSAKAIVDPIVVGRESVNKFDKTNVKFGVYVESTNGNEYANDSYFATGYQKCSPGTVINKNDNERIAFYDAQFVFKSGVAKPCLSVTMPEGCKYYRTSGKKEIFDIFMIQYDTNSADYEEPGGIVEYTQLAPDVRKKIDGDTEFEIQLPTTIYAVAGEQVSIYYRNIISPSIDFCKGPYSVRFQKKSGSNYEKFGTGLDYMYYFSADADLTLAVKIFDDSQNLELYSKDINVQVTDKSVKTTTKNIVWIGDSYSDGFGLAQNTFDILTSYQKTAESLGVWQTSGETVKHNAVAGASTYNFFRDKISDKTNPFYDPTTQTFDFSYFMAQNFADKTADIFVVALGINDITRKADISAIDDGMDHIQQMIDSAKAYNPDIKILIRTLNPQAYQNVRWENSYEANFMRANRMKYMQEQWNQAILDNFDNGQYNVYVLADGASFDTRYGINTEILTPVKFAPEIQETVTKDTHPNDIGSKQLADVFACAIANLI